MRKPLLLFLLLLAFLPGWTQSYPPNTTYFGQNGYIEYFSGSLPIILSSPHGGALTPASIPDRSCPNCVTVTDAYTQELAREVDAALFSRLGCHPHFVINSLKRIKLDANREIVEAALGNPEAEQAWNEYHHFIQAAKDSIVNHYGMGLFLDLHGHAHTIQRLELGYNLSKTALQNPDSILDIGSLADSSSIRNLVTMNLNGSSFSELLRGNFAFGTLCELDSYPATPSMQDPAPQPADPYFSGGYNIETHGSKVGGFIDAIQIECNHDMRFDSLIRREFADSLASVIVDFLYRNYFPPGTLGACNDTLSAMAKPEHFNFSIYPNPASDEVWIEFSEEWPTGYKLRIIHVMGQEVGLWEGLGEGGKHRLTFGEKGLPAGFYYVIVEGKGQVLRKNLILY